MTAQEFCDDMTKFVQHISLKVIHTMKSKTGPKWRPFFREHLVLGFVWDVKKIANRGTWSKKFGETLAYKIYFQNFFSVFINN